MHGIDGFEPYGIVAAATGRVRIIVDGFTGAKEPELGPLIVGRDGEAVPPIAHDLSRVTVDG